MTRRLQLLATLLSTLLAISAHSSGAEKGASSTHAYFGDIHLHTRYSNDAFAFMTNRTPDDAYRFAKGDAIAQHGGTQIRLRTPLDFLAVTDHAESLGVLQSFLDPEHPSPQERAVQMARSLDPAIRFQAFYEWRQSRQREDGASSVFDDPAAVSSAWQEIIQSADRHYQPGTFTTFAAYEWTASKNLGNLHRNVIFEQTTDLPIPLPAEGSEPEKLWAYMEAHRGRGVDAVAIPHNPNVSDGRMFALTDAYGMPLNAQYADRRNLNEPLVEVTQNKGTSETHPALSMNDEFADFELFTELLISNGQQGKVQGSYVRDAYIKGVTLQQQHGFNPFMFGLVGASDYHSGTSAVEEDNMSGGNGPSQSATPALRRNTRSVLSTPPQFRSAAGLTGVWAGDNTREEIFSAFRRREVFATTGTRIQVRLFAGWGYPAETALAEDRVERGYRDGVPMGSHLSQSQGRAPRLLVWAAKDPNSGNLDRIQIIKGWSEQGRGHEKIYDVALSDRRQAAADGTVPPVGDTVDVQHATYTNSIGDATLATVWEDPDFDPKTPAFYYARVLEIPTPRWTTYDAVALGLAPPEGVPASIQERAYTSPIWYLP